MVSLDKIMFYARTVLFTYLMIYLLKFFGFMSA